MPPRFRELGNKSRNVIRMTLMSSLLPFTWISLFGQMITTLRKRESSGTRRLNCCGSWAFRHRIDDESETIMMTLTPAA
jgi:hypothetical protein